MFIVGYFHLTRLDFASAIILIPVRFLNDAIMCYCFILHLFPVPAISYTVTLGSLSMYFVMRVCWFICSSSMLRIFGTLLLKKNRLSNSKLHHYFVVLHFWFLSFAWDSSNSFKSYFCFSYCFDCSFLFGFYSYRFTSFMGVCVVVIRLHFQRSSGRCHATQLN